MSEYELLTRVEVANYQKIGQADLSLGALNVIVGPYNLGKSALLRAICAALFNETGSDFIRNGQDECRVSLTFGDDRLEWIKTSKTALYCLNGREYTKLAGNVPQDVKDLTGIREIEVEKTFSIRPQVHHQFDQMLLLTESAGRAARALAKLTKLDIIVQAQGNAARDLRKARADLSRSQEVLDTFEGRLKSMPDVPALQKKLRRAEKLLSDAEATFEQVVDAEDAWEMYEAAHRDALAIGEVPSPEAFDALAEKADDVLNVLHTFRVWELRSELCKSLHGEEEEAETALKRAENEFIMFQKQYRFCPLCGQPWSAE